MVLGKDGSVSSVGGIRGKMTGGEVLMGGK